MNGTVRFVLCSQGRTGSHMLQSMLDAHSRIRCFGEIFNPRESPDKKPDSKLFLKYASPLAVLDHAWDASSGEPFVGFILHDNCESVRGPFPFDIFPHRELASLQDVLLIWLDRSDKLRQFVSEKIASITNVWNIPDLSFRPAVKPISIDPCSAEAWIKRTLGDRNAFLRMLGEHRCMSLHYEDLCTDLDGSRMQVLKFLGAGHENVQPKTCKVLKYGHISELVENYSKITKVFSDFGL